MNLKKIVSIMFTYGLLMACIGLFFVSDTSVKAATTETDIVPIHPDDYGNPIQENVYFDEELGTTVTERIYFLPDQDGIKLRSKSGSGWYKNEKSFSWTGGKITTYYAEGYFVWGNNDVSVSNARGGYDYLPSNIQNLKTDVDSGTGHYGGIFNKYAYVTYDLSFNNVIGIKSSYSVTIRISESGNLI